VICFKDSLILPFACQGTLRNYLEERGVRARPGAPLPRSVDASLVNAYEDGSSMGPDISNVALDWESRLNTAWNKDTIHILAEDFLLRIENRAFPSIKFDPSWMTLSYFKRLCMDKITAVRRTILESRPSGPGSWETADQKVARVTAKQQQAATAARRNSRRAVSLQWTIRGTGLTSGNILQNPLATTIEVVIQSTYHYKECNVLFPPTGLLSVRVTHSEDQLRVIRDDEASDAETVANTTTPQLQPKPTTRNA
jgi:hypothetical protein